MALCHINYLHYQVRYILSFQKKCTRLTDRVEMPVRLLLTGFTSWCPYIGKCAQSLFDFSLFSARVSLYEMTQK